MCFVCTGEENLAAGPTPAEQREPREQQASPAEAPPKDKVREQPSGTSLEHFEVGQKVIGIVTSSGPYSVFLDIGAAKDRELMLSKEDVAKLRKGDQVEGVLIDHIDVAKGQLGLRLPYELGDSPYEDDTMPELVLPQGQSETHDFFNYSALKDLEDVINK